MTVEIIEHWDDYLLGFAPDQQDIYFSENYVKLYQTDRDKALCVVATDNDLCMLMPILRREIKSGFFDFETPYGYGGFICNNNTPSKVDEALKNIKIHFAKNNYIAGFVRFHPLLSNANMCREQITVIDDRQTIAIDLRASQEDIWLNQIHTKNRNTIKKASKRGLEFVTDYNFHYIDDFIALYCQTMDKLGADSFYYFNRQYYTRWLDKLKERSFLAVVKFENIVISACIIMYQSPWGHYHLSGSNRDYLHLDPNNFMLWNAALELKHLEIGRAHV